MKDTELKACPCCGSRKTKTTESMPWTHCLSCGLEMRFHPYGLEQNKRAVELWNRWSALEAEERYIEKLKPVYLYDSGEDFMLRDEQLKKLERTLADGISKGIRLGFEQERAAQERDDFWERVFSKTLQYTYNCPTGSAQGDTEAELTLEQLLDQLRTDWRRINPTVFLSDRNEMITVDGGVAYYYENYLEPDFTPALLPKTLRDLKRLIGYGEAC